MANEADSKETLPNMRWAESAAEVPLTPPDLAEPSSGAKDLGWVASSPPNRAWMNWLGWGVGVLQRYLGHVFEYLWPTDHLMAGNGGGAGLVTAGAGLSVNVAAARVWIDGALYKVPAATNLALASADPSDERPDLVVARLNTGIPEWHVVTGTPGSSAPATPANTVKVATVAVPALAVVPGTITDNRLFGEVNLDNLEANRKFGAGWDGSRWLLRVFNSGIMWIGDGPLAPLLYVDPSGLAVDAANFFLFQPITRKLVLGPADFVLSDPGGGDIAYDGSGSALSITGSSGGLAFAAIRVPKGATITEYRVFGNRATTGVGADFRVFKLLKTSNAGSYTTPVAIPRGSGSTGDVMDEATGLSDVFDTDYHYHVQIVPDHSSSALNVFAFEVVYVETQPWITE